MGLAGNCEAHLRLSDKMSSMIADLFLDIFGEIVLETWFSRGGTLRRLHYSQVKLSKPLNDVRCGLLAMSRLKNAPENALGGRQKEVVVLGEDMKGKDRNESTRRIYAWPLVTNPGAGRVLLSQLSEERHTPIYIDTTAVYVGKRIGKYTGNQLKKESTDVVKTLMSQPRGIPQVDSLL